MMLSSVVSQTERNDLVLKKLLYAILYSIGLLFLLLTVGHRMVITSDIPPVYTMEDLRTGYTFNFITFIIWLIIFRLSNNKELLKWLVKVTPLLFIVMILIISIVQGKSIYIYHSDSLFSLDITLLVTSVVNIFYASYRFITVLRNT